MVCLLLSCFLNGPLCIFLFEYLFCVVLAMLAGNVIEINFWTKGIGLKWKIKIQLSVKLTATGGPRGGHSNIFNFILCVNRVPMFPKFVVAGSRMSKIIIHTIFQ